MENKIPQFNLEIFNEYDETYKISTLFMLPETDIKKLLKAGFVYDSLNNFFYTNIFIVNKTYNLRLGHYDGNISLYIKNENDSYNANNKKFSARKIVVDINNEKIISYNIDFLLLKFEQYINEIKYANTKIAMVNKIPNDTTIEINFMKNDIIFHKIGRTYIYGKTSEDKQITLEIKNTFFDIKDLITIDKLIEDEKLKAEINKNKTFKSFVFEDKNKIQ